MIERKSELRHRCCWTPLSAGLIEQKEALLLHRVRSGQLNVARCPDWARTETFTRVPPAFRSSVQLEDYVPLAAGWDLVRQRLGR